VKPRLPALALLALAATLHVGLTLPLQREAGQALAEYRRLREERKDARARLAGPGRGGARRAPATGTPADPLAALRRSALACLAGARVVGVRLEVRPAAAPAAATLRLSAEGDYAELVRLAGRLAASGVVLGQVRFAPAASGLLLDLEATSLAGSS
jgi:hypothetical protein